MIAVITDTSARRPGVYMLSEPARRSAHPPLSIVESTSAAARLKAAETFVGQRAAGTEIVVVGASRQAADDFVRELAIARAGGRSRATFGLHRFSLLQLAAFAAIPDLTAVGLAPASALGVRDPKGADPMRPVPMIPRDFPSRSNPVRLYCFKRAERIPTSPLGKEHMAA